MALFPNLEIESKVQLKDKTRLSAIKSFVSVGSSTITTATIKPGSDESAISVFNSDTKLRFLDWEFGSFKIDIDATNNKLDFKESGSELTATLTTSTYTLATLATEIKTKLDAAGTQVYTVSVSSDNEITISAPGGFSLLGETGTNKLVSILPGIGFSEDQTSAASYEGDPIDSLVRKITLIIGDGTNTATLDKYLQVFTETGDALFSDDADLTSHEADILKWVPPGRNSFKDVHRRSQELILAYLDEQGFTNVFDDKFTKDDILNHEEVTQWSKFMTLRLIFQGISNAIDDIFAEKAKRYETHEISARNRAILRLDLNKDKILDKFEETSISGGRLARR